LALVREVVGMGKLLDRFRQEGPKRPRSKTETEKRRRALILLLIVLAVVSSLSVVGYGYYETSVKPWRQPIVKVNGTVIRMRTFVKALRLNQVTESTSAPYIATVLEDYELKEQYLESEFGIEISEDEVDAKLREMLVSENATDEDYDKQYKNLVTTLKTNYNGCSVKDVKDLFLEPQLVEEELRKQIGDRDYPEAGTLVHAQLQALLIKGSDNATVLRTRWENGEAFDTLSADSAVSSYQRDFAADNTTANWVAKGVKSDGFDNYAFSATPGVLSDPIQDTDDTTTYWLMKVTGTEERALSEADRTTLIGDAYDKWLEDAKKPENNNIVYYLDKKSGPAKLKWALAHVVVSTSSG
jgi:hypothetical protein